MSKNLKQALMILCLLFTTFSPCKAMELAHVEKTEVEALPRIPNEVLLIILSFIPTSKLAYLMRINKSWAACIEKLLKHCPDKYLELCDEGFEKKKYSKLLDQVFIDHQLYKKFIKRVLESKIMLDEAAKKSFATAFYDKVADMDSEDPSNLFTLAYLQKHGTINSLMCIDANWLKKFKGTRIAVLLLSFGLDTSICCQIKGNDQLSSMLQDCKQLILKCLSNKCSKDEILPILRRLESNYIVPNFRSFGSQEVAPFEIYTDCPVILAASHGNVEAVEVLVLDALVNVKTVKWNEVNKASADARIQKAIDFLIKHGAESLGLFKDNEGMYFSSCGIAFG